MRKIWISFGVLAALLFSADGYANDFDRGIKLYRRADFKGAESAFLNFLRGGANRATKGRAYKYIGLSQYMMGRKHEARNSFLNALKYDAKMEIFPDEVLDSSVLEFFLQIKRDSKGGAVPVTSPPLTRRYPVHNKPITSKPASRKSATTKAARKIPARRAAPAKAAPKAVAKKPSSGKKTNTAKTTRVKRPIAKKKNKRQYDLFSGKSKKPRRITFDDKNDAPRERTGLLLPPSSSGRRTWLNKDMNPWHFLPFGVGQYVNNSYKIGHMFAAAGILTLGSFVYHIHRWGEDQDMLNDYYVQRENEIKVTKEKGVPQATQEKFVQDWDDYIESWEDYLTTLQLYSYISLGAFVAVWAGGVAEAILNRPSTTKYSLLPQIYYGHDSSSPQFALIWQYQLH